MKKYTTVPKPIILSALDKVHAVMKPSYGPAGRGVLLDRGFEQALVDDGFAIIEEFELKDELEQAVVRYLRDASRQTNKVAGDGTTTAFLLLYALVTGALKDAQQSFVAKDDTATAAELQTAVVEAVKQLTKSARKVKTLEDLEKIALNSYKNPEIAKLIAALVHKVGPDGVIAIENSDTAETTTEVVTGLSFDRGHISPYMAGKDGGPNELKNPAIIITDEPIMVLEQPLLDLISEILKLGKKDILIIAENVDGVALNAFVVNRLQGNANIVCVRAPGYGDRRYDLLDDLAAVTGATFLTNKKGRALRSITKEDLGMAKTVTVTLDDTTIIEGAGDHTKLNSRIAEVKALTTKGSEFDKEHARRRVASLIGGVGVINVGAPTESEQKAVKMKVEDAVNATKLAFKDGVIAGGGVALSKIKTDSTLLNIALQYPQQVLKENGSISKGAEDALGVAKAALESAVSVAVTLITCAGIITDEREEKKPKTED